MIENIKKEILKLDEIVFNSNYRYEPLKDTNLAYRKLDILKILDKYKDKEMTIRQLKENIKNGLVSAKELDDIVSELRQEYITNRILKHNISKEN